SATNGAGAAALTLAAPAGVAAGDLLLAQVTVRSSTTAITPPGGWALVRRDNTSQSIAAALYVKVATGAEPGGYTGAFDAAQKASGGVAAYSGVDPAAPVDAHGGQYNVLTTAATAPSVTTSSANDRLVFFASVTANTAVAPPGGMAERWDLGAPNDATNGTTSEMADQALTAAGASGDRVGTPAASGYSNVAQLAALRPAGAAATATATP